MKQNHIVPLYVSKVPLLGFWTTIVVYVTDRQGRGLMLFAPCGTGTDHNNYLDPLQAPTAKSWYEIRVR